MRNVALAVLCMWSISGRAQPKTPGSFTIAAICKDGILMASDTRSECSVRKDTVGYYDTVQKVFIVNNFAVANSGAALMGSDFFYHYIKEFRKTDTNCRAKDFLNNFLVFIKSKYPVYFDDFVNDPLIVAGYDKGAPYILETKKGKFNAEKSTGFKESDSLIYFTNDFFSAISCKDAAEIIERCIKDSVSKFHLETTTGGPLMALMITKDNKPAWIKNAPANDPCETTRAFIEAYNQGKLNFHFFSRELKQEFENTVK
jgi:20S proteasome alpha/beta subunit